jgi:hypothetical protein
MVVLWPLYGVTVQQYRRYIMVININGHEVTNDDGFEGTVVLSDTDETGTNKVNNVVVLSQASYNALTPNSTTLYFIT